MLNSALLTWLIIGGILTYIVAIDANVLIWLVLQSKLTNLWFRKQWFLIRYNPDSPWVRYEIKRNADRQATEMLKHFENKVK